MAADLIGPWIDSPLPSPGQGGLDPSTDISFNILDDYSGIDLAALIIMIDGGTIYDGSSSLPWQGDWNGTVSPVIIDGYDGYAVSFGKPSPFAVSSSVAVQVFAQDTVGNQLNGGAGYEWIFHTTSSIDAAIQGPFEITLDVLFSRDMTVDDALLDPGNYRFSGGMYARLAELLDNSSVRLWVEGYQGDDAFELTVASDIKDAYGYALNGEYASLAGLTPVRSDAAISAYNGLVRTWAGRENRPAEGFRRVFIDSQRVYLGGARGLEGFRRATKGTVARWAQVFDAYGVSAMFVANYDGDYAFADSDGPFLEDRLPAAGSASALPSTDIRFSISDAKTAVEIPAAAVYVSGTLVFAGASGGWMNGWMGEIRIRHRSLDFILKPPAALSPGTTVTVRVVASDLLGNSMDSSYSFLIGAGSGSGFGSGGFGSGSFGGGA